MKRYPDIWLILLIMGLVGLGCLLVTCAGGTETAILEKHILAILLGIGGTLLLWKINPKNYLKFSPFLLLISFTLLILVLFLGRSDQDGVRRAFSLGFLEFQPAELAKYALILFLAAYFSLRIKSGFKYLDLLKPLAVLGLMVWLLLMQPALGTALVMISSFCFFAILAGMSWRFWTPLTLIFIVLLGFAVWSTPYRRERVQHFFSRKNLQDINYQMYQSKLAIGSGKIWGKGIGQGVQKSYIPAIHTDFIFALLGEEMGLLGALTVLFCFLLLLKRGFKVSMATHNPFLFLLGSGITFMVVFQAFLNIGVALWLLPCTGVPLPLLSYGGTSLTFTILALGVLVRISAFDPREELIKDYKTQDTSKPQSYLREVG